MGEDPHFFPETMMLGFDPHGDSEKPYYTLRQHTYDDGMIDMVVPENFKTDLTTHPRKLGWIILALLPFGYLMPSISTALALVAGIALVIRDPLGRHQRAALFHDLNYQKQKYDRYTADAVYAIMLKEDGVGWVRRTVHYLGLRLFGLYAWRVNKRKKS